MRLDPHNNQQLWVIMLSRAPTETGHTVTSCAILAQMCLKLCALGFQMLHDVPQLSCMGCNPDELAAPAVGPSENQ